MPVDKQDFHMEEFKQLRAEVSATMAKAEAMLQYAVLIAAAVYSWLVTHTLGQQPTGVFCGKVPYQDLPLLFVWWIPPAAILIVGLLGGARFLRVKEAGQYLRQIENTFGDWNLGWEKFLTKRWPTVAVVSILAWVVLLVSTTFVAITIPPKLPRLTSCQKAPVGLCM